MHMSRNQKLFHKTEGYIWIRIIYCLLGGFTYDYINLVLDLYNQSDFTLNHMELSKQQFHRCLWP